MLAEEDGTPLVVEGPADTNPWLNLSSGDLNSDGNIDLVAGGRVFYGPFPEARAAAAADVVVEGASQGFSIVSDDLNFDGVDDLVCGLPGFMDFPADNEERGERVRPLKAEAVEAEMTTLRCTTPRHPAPRTTANAARLLPAWCSRST